MPGLSSSAVTHVGHVRNNNEDSYIACPRLGLWLVADGMGGQQSGEVASAIAVHTICQAIANQATLTEAITLAHRSVCEADNDKNPGMGTTVVALLSRGQGYEIAWVGDSRAYLWDLKNLHRLTRDHSMVQDMVDAGVISECEASDHPQRNIITQSVGAPAEPAPRVETLAGQWGPGESILLCSDGLNGELGDDAITAILAASVSPQDSTRQLLQAALARGGRDNITLVMINGPKPCAGGRKSPWRRVLQRLKKQAAP